MVSKNVYPSFPEEDIVFKLLSGKKLFILLRKLYSHAEIITQKRRKNKTSVPSMEYGTDAELMFLTKPI